VGWPLATAGSPEVAGLADGRGPEETRDPLAAENQAGDGGIPDTASSRNSRLGAAMSAFSKAGVRAAQRKAARAGGPADLVLGGATCWS
jgi:hypothetical protein